MPSQSSYFSQSLLSSTTYPLSLTIEELALSEQCSPLTLFTSLSATPWSMWLDSGDSEHVDSRFDILVWQPEITLTTQGRNTLIKRMSDSYNETSQADPLLLIKQLQAQIISPVEHNAATCPFLGGSVGYFAYDLGRRFEKLPDKASNDINLPEMAVGIYSQAIVYDNHQQQYYLICPAEKREQLTLEINELCPANKLDSSFSLTSEWQANMTQIDYEKKFQQVQDYLLSGDCYQINLAQRFSALYQGEAFNAYKALRAANKAPFSAFIRIPEAAILSVSPERFLQLEQGKVQTKPIKGTMPRSEDALKDKENAQTLAHSTKDKAENLMIVDLLRNDISKNCIAGSVKVPKLFDIESFPAVHHLVSTIEGQLQTNKDGCDLLRDAFPGGSITGAPKIRAMEIIEELEPHKRSVYCGSIGYISSCGNMDTSITIRTLIAHQQKQTIHCWAGGGLVADSTAASEYQETYDKVNKILPILSQLNTRNNS
ncbi:aminodeoxychorismate synthase component I [Litorilituus lipolyticus]|uniref:aminodeoxychorismate synthase n=1 Tax=Litorilituus lipolyticus TaxID=2491017 RepID=A0A502KLM9_9GAMM|nr:aminodeoxychorismate synthase component I [Litorilituus lipolyticus]